MIVGAMEFAEALEKMSRVDLRRGVAQAISFVQEDAKSNCPVHDGELRGSIFTEIKSEGDIIRGICYTNKTYAPFVEMGTGPKGQESHDGTSPEVTWAYSQSPWWIHEGSGANEIDRATAEEYHFFAIDTPEGRFYQCTGQAAQPFMYPALKNNADRATQIIAREVKKQL